MALQRGGKGLADRTNARPSSTEVCRNACQRETAWGTKGGMRRACTSATGGVRKSARERGNALATRLATATTSAVSVLGCPPAQRTTGYTVAQLGALEHAVAATCHRLFRPPPVVSSRLGGKIRRAQGVAEACDARRVRPRVQGGGARRVRAGTGVREVRAGVTEQGGGHGGVCAQKVRETQRGLVGGGAGAGATLLARARVVMGACRAP